MTDHQLYTIIADAAACINRDAFVSDWATSSIFDDSPDADIPPERVELLTNIYNAAHRSVRDIVAATGYSQRQFAQRFCIPLRTIENWCTGRRECPVYVRLMMQECLGLLRRE